MYLQEREQAYFDLTVADIFGFHALQIGLPEHAFLAQSRIVSRWTLDYDPPADIIADPHDARQRGERGPSAVQAHRQVVTLVALPVRRAVLVAQHVEVDRANRRFVARQELAEGAEAAAVGIRLDGDLVGRHDAGAEHGDLANDEWRGGHQADPVGTGGEKKTAG